MPSKGGFNVPKDRINRQKTNHGRTGAPFSSFNKLAGMAKGGDVKKEMKAAGIFAKAGEKKLAKHEYREAAGKEKDTPAIAKKEMSVLKRSKAPKDVMDYEKKEHKTMKFAKGGGIESKGKTRGSVVRMASGGKVKKFAEGGNSKYDPAYDSGSPAELSSDDLEEVKTTPHLKSRAGVPKIDSDPESFGQAFNKARKEGKGAKFTWNGKPYAAYKAGEEPEGWKGKGKSGSDSKPAAKSESKSESKPAAKSESKSSDEEADAPTTYSGPRSRGGKRGMEEITVSAKRDRTGTVPSAEQAKKRYEEEGLPEPGVEQVRPEAALVGVGGLAKGLYGLGKGLFSKSGQLMAREAPVASNAARLERGVIDARRRMGPQDRLPGPQGRLPAPGASPTPRPPAPVAAEESAAEIADKIRIAKQIKDRLGGNNDINARLAAMRDRGPAAAGEWTDTYGIGMKKGGSVKKFSRGGGIESRGKTRGRFI